jgi:hypothetical protein
MDEPRLTILDRRSRGARPYLVALAFVLLTGLDLAVAHGDEQWTTTRLPPVVNSNPPEATAGDRAKAKMAAVPERGKALFPINRSSGRSSGVQPMPAQESSLLSPSAPVTSPADHYKSDPAIQLTSLQEPSAKPAALAKVPQDPDLSNDAKAGDGENAKADAVAEKKAGQEPQTFGRKPESYALQFLRTQDVLLSQGDWQFDTGLVYTLFDNNFPVPIVDENTSDLTGVTSGAVRRRLLYTPLAARYGLTRNIQLSANLPMGYSNTQISTFGVSDSNNKGGIGDLTAGASFHLLKSEDLLPDVIATMDFTAPTGVFSTPIFGQVPGSNLGQGFWAMSGSLLFIHRYDPVIVFYGGGIRHLFEREFNGVLFSPGEQILYQFGVGFSVNDRVTLSTAFQGFYITNTQLDNQTVDGTNLEPISLRFAATIARNCRIIEPFVAIGATRSAPAANFGLIVTLY